MEKQIPSNAEQRGKNNFQNYINFCNACHLCQGEDGLSLMQGNYAFETKYTIVAIFGQNELEKPCYG